jgi:hypothetical protein
VLERELVQPLANLVATGQARFGDWVQIDSPGEDAPLSFRRETSGLSTHDMANFYGFPASHPVPISARSAAATAEYVMSHAAVRSRR